MKQEGAIRKAGNKNLVRFVVVTAQENNRRVSLQCISYTKPKQIFLNFKLYTYI